jgi:peptidyl-dipeptidase Dcp
MKKYSITLLAVIFLLFSCKENGSKNSQLNTETARMENPLLQTWDTPYGVPPFNKIKSEDYLPAIQEAIQQHKKEVDAIIQRTEAPTFKNTVEALATSGRLLNKVTSTFYAIEAANTDSILKRDKKIISPALTAHNDEIGLHSALFKKIKAVYDQRAQLDLTDEQSFLLEKMYKDYVKSGVNLPEKEKNRLKEINKRLSELSTAFGEHLLNETNNFELHVTDEADLGDLSEALRAAAAEEAKKRGHTSGWSFTLQRPSCNPFLASSPNRELREIIFNAYAMRGNNDNENDNKKIIKEMTALRVERANLLGFKTHADLVLSDNMAEKPEAVYNLMNQLWQPALNTAKKDRNDLAQVMKNEGVKGDFRGSDWRYYVSKIRKQKYNFNEDETRPYFEVNAVRDGAFKLAEKLFGLHFKPLKDAPTWHPDQQVFEVSESNGKHVGVLYMDFFARESKRGGAWMNELRAQSNVDAFVTPIVTNNFNFPPPTAGNPSLLSFTEAQTLFHEFGHALHGLLSNVRYPSLSGTNVPRDFVEFPSQVMENWMSEPEVLAMYAKHYKTGEIIPVTMVKKMNEANAFNEGFRTVEYMAAAYLDMDWHTLTKPTEKDVNTFEKEAMNKIGLIKEILPRYRSTYYAHIFSGGYSAGYYSYLWSEVLDADTFNEFKKSGDLFNPDLAKRYRAMLAAGGTKKGMQLYKDFLGRAPKIEPLLAKKGFE